ncbi:MAG: hypothetical protein AAGC90_02395 [Curtobacterium sp.]
MSDDATAALCSRFRGPVMDVVAAAIGAQGADGFLPVSQAVERLRAVTNDATALSVDAGLARWTASAPVFFAEVDRALEHRDGPALWAAVTHDEHGVDLLGKACAGHPGW